MPGGKISESVTPAFFFAFGYGRLSKTTFYSKRGAGK